MSWIIYLEALPDHMYILYHIWQKDNIKPLSKCHSFRHLFSQAVLNETLEEMTYKPGMKPKSESFPLAPMGVLASRSAHARPSARPPSTPIDTSGNFRRMCLQSNLQNFQKKLKNLKIAPQGAWGWGPEFYFFTRIFIYIS